jgi:2-polyprenyl-3-methyl-5-hydroxy-6-metoxy-1,4-benzoquinol methylase
MDQNKIFENIRCCVCGNKDNFIKKYYKDSFIVVECKTCSFNFIPQYFSKKMTYEDYKDENVLTEVRKGNDWLKMQRHLLRFKLIRKFIKDGKLFDLGVGWGHFLYTGKTLGYDVYGIEVAKTPYKYAKEDLGLSVELVDFFEFRVKNDTYDIITIWDVLEHIADADQVVKKCSKMIKEGGYIFIQVPQLDSLIAKRYKEKWRMMSLDHVNYFSRQTISTLLSKEGFRVQTIKSSFEFKLFLMYGILPFLQKIKSKLRKNIYVKTSDEAGKQAFFNKTTNLPRWVLKIIMIFHNILYNVLSFFKIGDEMIVVAKKIKK